mgnify:CR=1 FL=1
MRSVCTSILHSNETEHDRMTGRVGAYQDVIISANDISLRSPITSSEIVQGVTFPTGLILSVLHLKIILIFITLENFVQN